MRRNVQRKRRTLNSDYLDRKSSETCHEKEEEGSSKLNGGSSWTRDGCLASRH